MQYIASVLQECRVVMGSNVSLEHITTKPDSYLIFKNVSEVTCWLAWLGFLVEIVLLLY